MAASECQGKMARSQLIDELLAQLRLGVLGIRLVARSGPFFTGVG